jgi:hypothetical protein
MYNLFVFLLFFSPLLLLATYIMTVRRKTFLKTVTIHAMVFITYIVFTINYSKILFPGHDEYGLGPIVLGALFITSHVIIGFVHGLYITIKRRQTK